MRNTQPSLKRNDYALDFIQDPSIQDKMVQRTVKKHASQTGARHFSNTPTNQHEAHKQDNQSKDGQALSAVPTSQ